MKKNLFKKKYPLGLVVVTRGVYWFNLGLGSLRNKAVVGFGLRDSRWIGSVKILFGPQGQILAPLGILGFSPKRNETSQDMHASSCPQRLLIYQRGSQTSIQQRPVIKVGKWQRAMT